MYIITEKEKRKRRNFPLLDLWIEELHSYFDKKALFFDELIRIVVKYPRK